MSKTHSGSFWLNTAQSNGLETRMGKGDHAIIKGPNGRGYIVVPLKKELGKGLDCAIRSWFKALGILISIGLVIAAVLK